MDGNELISVCPPQHRLRYPNAAKSTGETDSEEASGEPMERDFPLGPERTPENISNLILDDIHG